MRVEQQNAKVLDVLKQSSGPEKQENTILSEVMAAGAKEAAYFVNQTEENVGKSVNVRDATYLKPETEEKKSAIETYEENCALDAAERKKQMVVLSNTTSAEDYARMQKEGFSLDETTANTIVTETDKIKAQLAKAGVDISFFGDELSAEQLEAIAGSAELARQLAQAMREADLPCTEGNQKDIAEAVQLAGALQTPDAGAVKYLLVHGQAPTIENLYKAEHSGSYRMQGEISVETGSFEKQIEGIIRRAGFSVNAQTMEESKWMLAHEIPLNEENLRYVDALRSIEFPVDGETLFTAITEAVSAGRRPQEAVLLAEYSPRAQAQKAEFVIWNVTEADVSYVVKNGMELNIRNLAHAMELRGKETAVTGSFTGEVMAVPDAAGQSLDVSDSAGLPLDALDAAKPSESKEEPAMGARGQTYTRQEFALLTARRQLEEIRLVMTSEANYALIKRGIAIDTQPLAALVEQLKEAENVYYENLLRGQGVRADAANVSLFRETAEKVEELKGAPACLLGMPEIRTASIDTVCDSARAMQDQFRRANERYETMMTVPRADLGDSIQKAFRNVDDILTDIGLETTEANRRAVRILGYNELSVTAEAVAEIKAVDEEVQRAFRNLTPATVIEMIRRDVNPLDMDFAHVNAVAEQIAAEHADTKHEKFGEFLWKLEQNHAITEEERASYIGTYRLIHQVEQSDGAAIGALVHQGTDITMRNLMMAVRSERQSGKMDYVVDESFGVQEDRGSTGRSITAQMETAYQRNCVKDILDVLTPGKLQKVMAENREWENLTPEQFKEVLQQADADEAEMNYAYAKERLDTLAQSAKVSEDIYAMLEKYDIPNTLSNVLAMDALARNRNGMFRQIFGRAVQDTDKNTDAEDIEQCRQEVLEAFGEAIASPEELAQAQERLGMLAENVMRGVLEREDVTSIDIREMHLLSAQLSVCSMLAKEEQYAVPVLVGDEIVGVSLKIVRGAERKGIVDITMESALRGKISAMFQAKEKGVTGLVAADHIETKELLAASGDVLAAGLEAEESTDIRYVHIADLELARLSQGESSTGDKTELKDGTSERYQVQTARLYRIAETFIRQIREVL